MSDKDKGVKRARELEDKVNGLVMWEAWGNGRCRVRRVPGGYVITEQVVFTESWNIGGARFPSVAGCSSVFVPK